MSGEFRDQKRGRSNATQTGPSCISYIVAPMNAVKHIYSSSFFFVWLESQSGSNSSAE